MSETRRFRSLIEGGTWLHPYEGGAGLLDLALALAALSGAPVQGTPAAGAVAGAIGAHDHMVFVLVDGLGMHLVDPLEEAAFLRQHVAMRLRSVFPSSTAPALTSLATGLPPAAHAVTGWWMRLPRASLTATILPFIERFSGEPLGRRGVDARDAFPAPSLLAKYRRDRAMFLPSYISESVSSRYFSAAAPAQPYRRLAEAVDGVAARIAMARGPTYTYVYVPFVDQAQHERGPQAVHVRRALSSVVQQLERLAGLLTGRARVVLTADHGHIAVGMRHIIMPDDPLMDMLEAPPYGEPRVPMFRARPGMAEAFADAFRARFGERFVLLSTDDAEALRLFGEPTLSDETRARIGDFIAPALGDDVLLYDPDEGLRAMEGTHGGLTPAEMMVPLVLI